MPSITFFLVKNQNLISSRYCP